MQTEVKTYKNAKDYQHDVKRMQRHGWSVASTVTNKKHHLLRRDEQKIVVTYQKGSNRPAAASIPVKPMSRNAKIGCGVFTGVVLVLILIAIGSFASQASQYAASQDAEATTTAQAQSTSDASAVLQVQDTPTDQPTDAPTIVPTQPATQPTIQPTHQATPKPTPKPTQPPACQATNNNPWCFNFTPGNYITNPPADFCSYFNCIASFVSADDPDGGYVVECADTTYSQSGGESGACSHHGGVMRPLYSH